MTDFDLLLTTLSTLHVPFRKTTEQASMGVPDHELIEYVPSFAAQAIEVGGVSFTFDSTGYFLGLFVWEAWYWEPRVEEK